MGQSAGLQAVSAAAEGVLGVPMSHWGAFCVCKVRVEHAFMVQPGRFSPRSSMTAWIITGVR